MQRNETIEFWNQYYHQNDDNDNDKKKEWIVLPTSNLLSQLVSYMPTDDASTSILEIGCGTSTMARELARLYPQMQVTATDVSPVCVMAQNNQARDATTVNNNLEYKVLNVLEPNINLSVDVILDKGCLDTFLFRSASTERDGLVAKLLSNVHQWLLSSKSGVYLVLSPRSKLKPLRDYPGFSCRRVKLDTAIMGTLEGDTTTRNGCAYLYICHVQEMIALDDVDDEMPTQSCCPKCTMSLEAFCGNRDIAKTWRRRWKGHLAHCRG